MDEYLQYALGNRHFTQEVLLDAKEEQTYTASMSLPLKTVHHVFAYDCPDAVALAEFYSNLLGWQIGATVYERLEEERRWVDVRPPANGSSTASDFHIAFQQVDNYVAPEWPDGAVPQQGHLDFYVNSIAESEPLALAAGARKHTVQPGENDGFTVFLDPAGHLFCLCEADDKSTDKSAGFPSALCPFPSAQCPSLVPCAGNSLRDSRRSRGTSQRYHRSPPGAEAPARFTLERDAFRSE